MQTEAGPQSGAALRSASTPAISGLNPPRLPGTASVMRVSSPPRTGMAPQQHLQDSQGSVFTFGLPSQSSTALSSQDSVDGQLMSPDQNATADASTPLSADQTHVPAARRSKTGRRSHMARVEPPTQDSSWLRCGLCPDDQAFCAANSGGLLRHISSSHRGCQLHKQQVRQLQYLGKVACVECGALRDHKSAYCGPCARTTRQRAIRRGDRTPGLHRRSAGDCQSVSLKPGGYG